LIRRSGVATAALALTTSAVAVTALGASTPTAGRLLAKVKICHPTSSARFGTDEQRPRTIPVCGTVGALFWKADLDIDCDGQVTSHCNLKEDASFQPGTALSPGGRPLAAEKTPYLVIPRHSAIFDYRKHDIQLGAVAAIVYKNKVAYAVFGDTGPKEILGEASYRVAALLGIDPDPSTGGAASGVTYIVFKNTKVADPGNPASIMKAGQAAAAKFLRNN
jgi:Fungal chitosanase of glycosyl hydrolase group 75